MSTLTRFRPHRPTADPFADTWYCYVNDPELGYLKIVLVTYLSSQTHGDEQHAYVHVALAPLDGPQLTLADVSVSARFDGAHEHYWPGPDEAASPFTGPTDGESGRSHWFVFTLGTPWCTGSRTATARTRGAASRTPNEGGASGRRTGSATSWR